MKGIFASAIVLGLIGVSFVACSSGGSSSTPPTTEYALTVQISPSGEGTVAASPNNTQYASGTVVTLTATAASGYMFSNWTGDAAGTANPTTVTMNGNKTVTANFASYKMFAYVANGGNGEGNVSAYAIDPNTGALTEITGSPFAAGGTSFSVAVDPTGTYAYVANWGSNNVSAYAINSSTGALTEITGSPFTAGTNPISVAVDPTSKFAYVVNYTDGTVSAYTINSSTGALTEITGSPFAAGGAGALSFSVAVDPTGKFVYVANENSADVSAYTINSSTGALTEITGSPFASGTYPYSVTVDPTGKFAYVANGGFMDAGTVSAYTINSSTGALTEITGSPLAAGDEPRSVAVDPTGKFAYVANEISSDIYAYAINSSTGALTEITAIVGGNSPLCVTTIRIKQ